MQTAAASSEHRWVVFNDLPQGRTALDNTITVTAQALSDKRAAEQDVTLKDVQAYATYTAVVLTLPALPAGEYRFRIYSGDSYYEGPGRELYTELFRIQ